MKYFKIKEFEVSATAATLGLGNRIPSSMLPNVYALVEKVLDPLREAYGKPIHVTSGYRSRELNRAIKGSMTSHHLTAQAADIVGTPASEEENKKLFELVQELDLPFTQLIDESDYSWIHISYDPNDIRKQVLHLT